MPDLSVQPPPRDPLFPEIEFQAAMRALGKPRSVWQGLILVASLAAFVLVQQQQSASLSAIVILVGVVLFHELGHYAGMRIFGYRDVRMFFIPFFGAAVSGRRGGVAAWKEGVVLLLGPAPGIAVAFVLALGGRELSPAWHELGLSMLAINAFNLLPLSGLDGARLLEHVLFSRRRWLEVAFRLCATAGMIAYAVSTGSWVLGIFAYLMLMVLPHRWKVLGAANQLRASGVTLPADARELGDDVGRTVFASARGLLSQRGPAAVAAIMEQLVDAAAARAPGFWGSMLLGGAWMMSLILAVVAAVLLVGTRTG